MKTFTVNVSETVHNEFRFYAARADHTVFELIREAIEEYRQKPLFTR